MAEKIGSMLLTLAVRLVILRLLTRDILGFMSIPSAVVTVLLVIVDGGFSQSLIRHRNPREYDYKSVFLFNIAMAALLYAAVLALSPLVARWYGMPEIARIAPVFFLLLPLNALCSVQNSIFVRQYGPLSPNGSSPLSCGPSCCGGSATGDPAAPSGGGPSGKWRLSASASW